MNDWTARFDAQLDVAPNGCWVWKGYVMPNGYAQFWLAGAKRYIHRIAYERHTGAIPEGYDIDHLCRNRACCNPAHLEAVTHRENVRRGAKGSLVTSCRNGHPYTAESTMTKPNGTRRCRICCNANSRRRYANRSNLTAA